MTDVEFKTFDKTPIVPVVNISRWSFGLREVILAIIAGILLLMCLVFAGLFGSTNDRLSNVPTASAIVGNNYCTLPGCLKTAARAVSFINKSVDPCQNFYQYACGNYKKARRVMPNEGGRNVIQDLRDLNEDRIIDVLEQPISAMHDWAAERKLKKFFTSCNDMFMREKQRGLPVLTKVLPALGGWKVLGTWDSANWDLNTALKAAQSEFWVDALYGPRVIMDPDNGARRIIRLNSAGVGKFMNYWWYTYPSWYENILEDYKKFIRRVGSLLVRDASTMLDPPQGNNASVTEELLDEFVNDTFTMEHQIARLSTQRPGFGFGFWGSDIEEKITLNALATESGDVIDWAVQVSHLFHTAGVSGSTVVGVWNKPYFKGLNDFLASMPEAEMKRMVHNYLVWRVAESYVQELSWEYIHANREVYFDIHGRADFSGLYRYCFVLSQYYMGDALNHLYITQFLDKKNKDTAHEISDNIRLAIRTQLAKTPWMDESTRKYAQEKIDSIDFKIGFPDWMANQGEIDDMYSSLVVNASDFFGNVLRMNQFRRTVWNADLQRRGTLHEEWVHAVHETTISFSPDWKEIAAPAGMLQFPIYDADQPHSSTFGSLGTMMAMIVHRFVDDWGMHIDKEGKYMDPDQNDGTWWSNTTVTKFNAVTDCVKDIYSNFSRTVQAPDGSWVTLKVDGSYMYSRAMAWTDGIKAALLGYQDWVKDKGIHERMVPGLDMSYEQMVFLGHAQTMCEVWDPHVAYLDAMYGGMTGEMAVNAALGQTEEFSNAFLCMKDDEMNHPKKCQYYI